jgi:hypothetical protein
MNGSIHRNDSKVGVNRRGFCALAAGSALAALMASPGEANAAPRETDADSMELRTGNGEWTYEVVRHWGDLPAGTSFGGTHGAIASDRAGNLYVSTQSETGILVFDRSGKLLRTIAESYPEVHSFYHAVEDGEEYFYATVQKGTPKENWLFVKLKTDGSVAQKITAPGEAGFHAPNEWRITSAVAGPDGSIFIANGYGDSRIFHFDKQGNYKASFSGKGSEDSKCDCCHGLAVDLRYDQPLLLVCDRENLRLSHYDFDGKFVKNVTLHLRRPCQVSFLGDYALVSELQGRATILDKDNVPVAFLGDNPQKAQWANYGLSPEAIAPTVFSAAHGCFFDSDGSVYVSDWNKTGRVTKLARVKA